MLDDNAPTAGSAPAANQGSAPAAPAAQDAPATPPASGSPPAPAAPAPDAGKPADNAAPAADAPKTEGDAPKDPPKAEPVAPDWTAMSETIIAQLSPEMREKAREFAKTRPPIEVYKAALAAQSKITELSEAAKGRVKVPGKDAKPEEIAEFEKAIGVPETADKYEIKRPDGVEVTDFDKIVDTKAKEAFKAARLNQDQVDALVKLDLERQELATQEATRRVVAAAEAAQNDLRIEWGVKEYAPQVAAIQRYVDEVIAKDFPEAKALLDERFADGTALGEKPGFLKWLARHVVNPWMDDNGLVRGAPGDGVDLDKRIEEIKKLQVTDPKEYAKVQPEYDRLLTAQAARGKKKEAA